MDFIRVNYHPAVIHDCDVCEAGHQVKPFHSTVACMIVGCWLPQLKLSRNRSKRIRKKLHKKLATPMLGPPLTLVLGEKTVTQIEFALANRRAA